MRSYRMLVFNSPPPPPPPPLEPAAVARGTKHPFSLPKEPLAVVPFASANLPRRARWRWEVSDDGVRRPRLLSWRTGEPSTAVVCWVNVFAAMFDVSAAVSESGLRCRVSCLRSILFYFYFFSYFYFFGGSCDKSALFLSHERSKRPVLCNRVDCGCVMDGNHSEGIFNRRSHESKAVSRFADLLFTHMPILFT